MHFAGPSDVCQGGTSWRFPNCAVEYPLSFNVIANAALVLGRIPLEPGAAVAVSVIRRLCWPTERMPAP